ncbi:ats1 [Malassezia furfur]|nr:ats1 [Malassezia furfur]
MTEPLMTLVRPADRKDIPTILGFIRELATYERALDQVQATEKTLEETLFDRPYAHVLIAEVVNDPMPNKPVGFALYYYAYSTWTSRPTLFLEDLFVLKEYRNHGLGKRLFRHLGEIAKKENCPRIEWNVLTPSIAFYKETLGAQMLDEWRGMRLEGNGIERLASLSTTEVSQGGI